VTPGPALRAGVEYFLLAFAAGAVLGVARRLLLAPALGEAVAVSVELPLLLGFAWLVCRRLVARHAVPAALGARLAMGAFALALLLAAELGLGALLGLRPAEQFGGPAGLLGLAGQVAFGLLPALQGLRAARR
jgi:hypothetical protein